MRPNDRLLTAIKARAGRKSSFGYGIVTADRYVRTLQECVGLDACYKYASAQRTSFGDVLEKAARTLVYSNEDMVLEEKLASANLRTAAGDIEVPKNTLMIFRHVLTSDRKDRDGDVLRTKGASVDPKMLLLWQHVHTLPIGKMLAVASHTDRKLRLISAVVDMNETSHDAAVMADNGMARFSHGFRALDFLEQKEGRTDDGPAPGGFDVKQFEIMEESMVSVPANIDAETEEVLLSLVEGGKLTSGIMKSYGKTLRAKRPVTAGSGIKYREKLGEFERVLEVGSVAELEAAKAAGLLGDDDDEATQTKGTGDDHGCTCGGKKPASEEAADDAAAGKEGPTVPEVTDKAAKAGRVLSKANESKLRDVCDDLKSAAGMDIPRPCKALLKSALGTLEGVLSAVGGGPTGDGPDGIASVPSAMTYILTHANRHERGKLTMALKALDAADDRARRTNEYLALTGKQ